MRMHGGQVKPTLQVKFFELDCSSITGLELFTAIPLQSVSPSCACKHLRVKHIALVMKSVAGLDV